MCTCMCMCMYEDLAHVVIWRLRSPRICSWQTETQERQCIQFHSESKSPRTRGTGGVNSSLKAERSKTPEEPEFQSQSSVLAPAVRQEKIPPGLFRPSVDWMRPTYLKKTICFTQYTVQMLITPRITRPSKIKFDLNFWAVCDPVKLTH